MIDFHNHLVPGVDDGAADLDQSRVALAALHAQGVHTVVTTPHLQGSLTGRPEQLRARLAELDEGWERLRQLAREEFDGVRVERGAEVMLDSPALDLSDGRTRLAGTPFVLVEFGGMTVPPNAALALYNLKSSGWTPVIAHPERYRNLDPGLEQVEEWKRMGALLQVNAGSLLGRYGTEARATSWRLLEGGWADYLSSDYHARGRVALAEVREALLARGGEEQAALLMETNAARLLLGEQPLEVPPLERPRPLWRRVLGRR